MSFRPGTEAAAGQKFWFLKIIHQRVIPTDIWPPKIVAAFSCGGEVPAGEDQMVAFLVFIDEDEIKQPADPPDRYFAEKPAPGLGWGHFKINPAAAVSALLALASQLPVFRENVLQ